MSLSSLADRAMLPLRPCNPSLIESWLRCLGAVFQSITFDGSPYSRAIASLFDAYRQILPRRFSSAV
jgi:hypothetical protein